MTTKDADASAGQSPLPPPGPFVTPITSAKFNGIQPKFSSLVKTEYKSNEKEEKDKKKGKKSEVEEEVKEEKMEEEEKEEQVAANGNFSTADEKMLENKK